MVIEVIRKIELNDCQIGEILVDGKHFGYTLEDISRDEKVYGATAIPSGKYNVIVDYSEHFNKFLPHVLNVPRFAGIRIHGGNTAKDTEGCILVGLDEWPAMHKISNCAVAISKLTLLIKAAKIAILYVGTQDQIDNLKKGK